MRAIRFKKQAPSCRRQRGFTLPEMVAAAAVVAASTTALSVSFKAWDDSQRAANLGESLLPVYHAVDNYVRANWSELQKAAPSIAGFTTPHAPTVAQLQTAGYFTAPYVQGQNLINANALIQLTRSPTGCAPVNCDVTYTVYYDRPVTTSTGFADIRTASTAAKAMDGVGGFSTVTTPGAFSNADGTWTGVTNPLAQAGVIAAYGSLNTSGNAAYVRVGDNRDPNLQGNLSVAGNTATTGTLSAGGNISTSANVSATGSMTASGTVRGGTVQSTGETYSGGWFRSNTAGTGWYHQVHGVGMYAQDSSWVRAYNNAGIYTGGQMQAGSLQSNGSLTVVGQIVSYARETKYASDWAIMGYDGSGGAYTSPGSHIASAYLNDAYFRAAGKWASQMTGANVGGGPYGDSLIASGECSYDRSICNWGGSLGTSLRKDASGNLWITSGSTRW